MEKKLYPNSPVRVVISGPSGSGKTCLLTKLITEIINEISEIYIYIYIYIYIFIINSSRNISKIDRMFRTKNTSEINF